MGGTFAASAHHERGPGTPMSPGSGCCFTLEAADNEVQGGESMSKIYPHSSPEIAHQRRSLAPSQQSASLDIALHPVRYPRAPMLPVQSRSLNSTSINGPHSPATRCAEIFPMSAPILISKIGREECAGGAIFVGTLLGGLARRDVARWDRSCAILHWHLLSWDDPLGIGIPLG